MSCRALVLWVTLIVLLVSVVLRVSASLATPMVRALLVMLWRFVPLVVGVGPRPRGISSQLLAEGAVLVAAGGGGGCDGVVASAIPPVNPELLTLKHSTFLEQLLMVEVNLGEFTPSGSQDHTVFSMRATDGSTGQVRGAKSSPKNMPVS